MAKWGMTIDLDRCTACQACVTACQAENNLPPTGPEEASQGRNYTWMEMIPFEGEGERPKLIERLLPRPCLHCDNPPCVKVCPVEATWQEADGITVIDYDWCIGCRYCEAACPYWARRFNFAEPKLAGKEEIVKDPDIETKRLNTNMSYLSNRPRPKGVMEKCTFCLHRTREGRMPACLEVCPTGARKFGNVLDPDSDVSQILNHKRIFILKEEVGTLPRFFYYFDERYPRSLSDKETS